MLETDLLIFRKAGPDDLDFILSCWLRSYRLSDNVKHLEKDVYFAGHHEIARRLLEKSDVKLLVSSEDPDTIVACMISQNQWIHYVYTKHQFRRMGLAKSLVGDPAKWSGYTHQTILSKKIKLPRTWKYNPYKALLSS